MKIFKIMMIVKEHIGVLRNINQYQEINNREEIVIDNEFTARSVANEFLRQLKLYADYKNYEGHIFFTELKKLENGIIVMGKDKEEDLWEIYELKNQKVNCIYKKI